MTLAWSTVDMRANPPSIAFPPRYNAAVDLVDRQVIEGRGQRFACVDDGGAHTYFELQERVNRTGNALLEFGIEPEQRVLMLMVDTIDFLATFLGAIKIGAVPVPINTMLTPADYRSILRDSRARAIVVSDVQLPKLGEALLEAPPRFRGVIVARSPLTKPSGESSGDHARLDDLAGRASSTLESAPTTPDDIAFWLYSSGSTGAPKGAMHLHAHLMRTSVLYARGVLGIDENDVVFSAAKLFFAYGLGNALTFPLSVGATSILLAERPTPGSIARVMRRHQPTIFCGVPTLFAALLADTDVLEGGLSSRLRFSVSAGEALPRHIGENWKARFRSDILDGIGSTELLHIFSSNRPDDIRYGTSGKPVPGYEMKLLGDDGQPVSEGEAGSLWVRSPTACVGYWNNRERSLSTFHGPWTCTGDRYARDAAGYYTFAGRVDDMLKVGGLWVSPFEVESALSAHDAVLEAAVVGHSDGDGLIKPKAFVVLKDRSHASPALESELKAFVKDRLALYKYPRWIEFIAELPKTPTGKIQRFRLRG